MEFETELPDGRPVLVDYEFEEGDSSVGLADSFEFCVYFEKKDITDDLSDQETQSILAEIREKFDQYITGCRAEADIDRAEQAIADRQWEKHYGY